MDKELQAKVRKMCAAKTQAEVAEWLYKVGQEKSAKTQLSFADYAMPDDRGGFASLAQTILAQQSHKIEQYGEKAYPLSQKQCEAIAREIETR